MAPIIEFLEKIPEMLAFPLFEVGETTVTLWTVTYLLVLILLFIFLVNRLIDWMVNKLLTRTNMDLSDRKTTGTIMRYIFLAVGLVIILQSSGVDLTIISVLAGTLGIGVGFGLQNIVNNFVSGLILLFEKPIRVGDRIEVGSVHGKVTRIGARSATVLTNDNISIIIPNLKFITENIVNWSRADEKVRFRIPIIVAADSDPYLVEQLLLEAAREDPDVLEDPEPGVRLFGFGENGMDFELRAWSHSLIQRRGYLTSKLNYAILDKFTAHNIELVIPQREVFLRQDSTEVES